MQSTIVCSVCAHIIPWKVPELTADVWHASCPACDSSIELEATLGKDGESPSFAATGERLLDIPPLPEPKP